MKTTLLLVRHGETEWNKLGKFQGCIDIELSEEGIAQAELLRDRINGDFDVIYASPLKRAFKTAEMVASINNAAVNIAEDIREINFGEWEGLTLKSIEANYPDIFKVWRTDKIEAPIVGGDASLHNASIRAKRCILDIVNKNKGKKIVIVAHGGIIKAGLIGLFDWEMTMYHKIGLGNTCINTISFDEDMNPSIVCINDTSHLKGEAKTV